MDPGGVRGPQMADASHAGCCAVWALAFSPMAISNPSRSRRMDAPSPARNASDKEQSRAPRPALEMGKRFGAGWMERPGHKRLGGLPIPVENHPRRVFARNPNGWSSRARFPRKEWSASGTSARLRLRLGLEREFGLTLPFAFRVSRRPLDPAGSRCTGVL